MSGRGKAEDWASEGGGGERNQLDAVGEYDYNVSNTGVLYITEDMLRRYSDPLPPMRMRSLKIDGSRRDDKIRCVLSSPLHRVTPGSGRRIEMQYAAPASYWLASGGPFVRGAPSHVCHPIARAGCMAHSFDDISLISERHTAMPPRPLLSPTPLPTPPHQHLLSHVRMSLLVLLPWCILCFNPKAGIVDAPAQPLPRRTLDTMDMVPNLKELILPCHSIERIINVSRLSENSPP